MTSMPWIKSYTKKLDDIRLARTSATAQLAYFKMELLAGKCDADGSFVMNGEQLTEEEIAFYIRMDTKDIKKAMKELAANRLVTMNGRGPQLTDFPQEQVSQDKRREAWRERQNSHRSVTRDNEDVTRDNSVTHAPRTRVQNKNKNQSKNRGEKKRPEPTTPTPPKTEGTRLAGGLDSIPSFAELLRSDRKAFRRAELAMTILKASGLRNPKLKTTSIILATRIYKKAKTDDDFKAVILAALASSYADPTAVDKAVIAAHRLETDQVPPQFKDSKSWNVIPRDVLEKAGITLDYTNGDRWEIKR